MHEAMPVAILSDIHGNLPAFEAVLEDMDACGVHEIISLGDNVGYGPQPDEVVRLCMRRGVISVAGNHEAGVLLERERRRFNFQSHEALMRTIALLSDCAVEWIASLPRGLSRHGCRFVHGMPPDSVHKYLFAVSGGELKGAFQAFLGPLCFVGHTHDLELVCLRGGVLERRPLEQGPCLFDPDCRYIVNVGSAGQPRDGDNRAKYALWWPDDGRLEMRFVSYDIERAVALFAERGMPLRYAQRLR
ncbi:metallophosphoesterase family protein [Oleidesulfovibrio alaskensis]|jgi:predicted phosphodiesterase|uniref:metallophosphoesterase family protein n=1 Tax=Oleidesulfovibrio alaskensis TaxID=58180 RepID=UPI0023571609|nr:metallophosphoesterase family protein [Oleidesulfovibrio alaskensis]